MILTTCLALLSLAQDADPTWVLVRGPRELPARTSYEAIAKTYLQGQPFEIVRAEEAKKSTCKSRFIFGSITDNPVAAEVFGSLGGRVEGETLYFASMTLAADAGIAIVAPDVDGEGELILMTGGNSDGAFACLTAPVDVGKHGWTAIHERKIRGRGPLPGTPDSETRKLQIDGSLARIIRLDEDARHLLSLHDGEADDEAALRIARAFRGSLDVIRALGFRDGLEYGRWLLDDGPRLLEKHGEFAGGTPALLHEVLASVEKALGKQEQTQPVYFFVWGRPDGTSARTFDSDPETGRPRVLLNLAALETTAEFRAAAIHETIHTRQTKFGRDLPGRAATEGIACFLTRELETELSVAEALMWSEEELAAARKHEEAIRQAFERASRSGDPEAQSAFLQLGKQITELPAAPSRTAYWLGYLAAKRWRAANPDTPLEAMLHLGAEDLFSAD